MSNKSGVARCAIYTRKSTEHGLELEFNSLDAQHEACAAYVKSQVHEGWQLSPKRYDDAAFSGGTLERPALQRLLGDIEAGSIDIIVVYKIDRLTRSLADFAKLVEIFDKRGISFVAVTQQFNTTTSMGRLTLNVLLSFAQFERELASERVKDKIAASKRKGKWMGGGFPLGYEIADKKLVVNADEAASVRTIFELYLDLKCLRLVVNKLIALNIRTKVRMEKGQRVGGRHLQTSTLAYLLKNRTYLGEIAHDDEWFSGEHEAIIDPPTFRRVQDLLKANAVVRRQRRAANTALLIGKVFDEVGNQFRATYTVKRGVRYRFYVNKTLIKTEIGGIVRRIAAAGLERAVIERVREQLKLADTLSAEDVIEKLDRIVVLAAEIQVFIKSPDDTTVISRIVWEPKGTSCRAEVQGSSVPDNSALIHAITRASAWLQMLEAGPYQSVEELALAVDLHPKVVRKGIRLAFLPPRIVESILLGRRRELGVATLGSISASWPIANEIIG